MADRPNVSTITACYQKGNYLKTFLEELPKQTYFSSLEIVLDHNEPTEAELRLVQEFQRKYPDRIHHLLTDPVEPLGASWNRCIRESSGKYLTIWNIDDLRTPRSIETQAEFLDKNPGIDIVTGNFSYVSSFPSTMGRYLDNAKIHGTEMTKNMTFGPFFMFRKELCRKAGFFDEQFRCANDEDFVQRLLFFGKGGIINEHLGYFLDEGKGASTRPGSPCPAELHAIYLRYGMYDRINYQYLPRSFRYNIYNIRYGGKWVPVGDIIPGYEEMLEEKIDTLASINVLSRQWGIKMKKKMKNMIKKKE
jgi:glycosyltransferase involved in cell wall biosynthesis